MNTHWKETYSFEVCAKLHFLGVLFLKDIYEHILLLHP